MAGRTYLRWTMLRRLLACLALVTGLAAVGAPAQASFAEALEQLEIASSQSDKAKTPAEECEARQQAQRKRGLKPAPCADERPVTIYLPTVMFGPDRALE